MLETAGSLDFVTLQKQVLASVLHPSAKPIPLPQQRLMSDLNGGAPRDRIAIKGEQTMGSEPLNRIVEPRRLDIESTELCATHPTSGVVGGLINRDQTKKDMLGGSLLGQQKYAEAEPLLLAGYEGLQQREQTIPPRGKVRLTEAIERLVQLYEATSEDDKAAEWRTKLPVAKSTPPADTNKD